MSMPNHTQNNLIYACRHASIIGMVIMLPLICHAQNATNYGLDSVNIGQPGLGETNVVDDNMPLQGTLLPSSTITGLPKTIDQNSPIALADDLANDTKPKKMSISECQAEAERGNAEAQFIFGLGYWAGLGGVTNDPYEAFKWFQKAANQGNAEAQNMLGVCYSIGRGAKKDIDQALIWFHKAAEQGNADAQNLLGSSYDNGIGVARDPAQAVAFYQKAANKGHADAQARLGECYLSGYGCEKNPALAVEWFIRAAKQGNVSAQLNLGLCFAEGEGVEKDPVQAALWYRRAAEQGNAEAQFGLGLCYARGEGVEKDPAQAAFWYRKVAEQGNAVAQLKLSVCYARGEGVEKDPVQAAFWCHKAAEQGDDIAQLRLGLCFEEGKEVEKDPVQAAFWYRKAAEQGNEQAHFFMGQLYLDGEGVIQNDHQACVHFLISGALGNSEAAKMINLIRQERLSVAEYEDAQQEAKDWLKKFIYAQQDGIASGDGSSVATQSIETLSGSGSGFVINMDGYFLTCAHVVEDGGDIKVCLNEKTYTAKLIRADMHNDVALLKLDGPDFHALALSQSLPEMGDKVFTMGFPNPELQGASAKYTDGVISSLFGIMDDVRTMQITAPIQGGNSGGPLVDDAGNVIGIVVAQLNAATVFEYTGTIPQNVNFAVKINYALPLIQSVPGLVKNLPQPRTTTPDNRIVADVQAATGMVLVYE